MLAAFAFIVAYALQGLWFIASLIIFSWVWALVFVIWYLWRMWYLSEHPSILDDDDDFTV